MKYRAINTEIEAVRWLGQLIETLPDWLHKYDLEMDKDENLFIIDGSLTYIALLGDYIWIDDINQKVITMRKKQFNTQYVFVD